jgi:hyaluronan synthase
MTVPVTVTVPNLKTSIRRWYPFVGLPIGLYLAFLGFYHYNQLTIPLWRVPVIIVSFIWMAIILVLAHLNRPKKGGAPNYRVATVIPSKNEDPLMLRAMLESLDKQTMLPTAVYLVENGATNGDAQRVFEEWQNQTRIPRTYFHHNLDEGKRDAQAVAFDYEQRVRTDLRANIFLTMDGDTQLDDEAINQGLIPFNDPKVMSVGGLLVGLNRTANLLTRIVNIGFVSSFTNGRAAWSRLNSVAVNCGGLAFYRAEVIWKYLTEYTNQTVVGKKASTGDDRMLTGLASLEGKTFFQETSVAYTLLPVNLGHLTRQRGRWWRSFWWGGVWLLRRHSPTRAIWWLVLSQYITFVLYAVMIPVILLVDPIMNSHFPWVFFLYIAGLSYIRSARTLAVRVSDQSLLSQVGWYLLLSPLVTLLNLWVCTVLQWWGLATFYVTGWQTRQKVEVGLQSA